MGKYVLTGADGHLGTGAADFALELKAPTDQLILTSFTPDKVPAETVQRWTEKGAEFTYLNYDDVPGMIKIFAGADAISFISTWLIGDRRRGQHKNVVDAAKAAGVKRICYTSFVGAGLEKDLPVLPQDHRYTEQQIYASGLQYSIQRDYLYGDNLFQLFAPSWKYCGNKWYSNSKGAPAAFVARADCSRVLGALLMGKGEPNTVYHVTGPEAISDHAVFDKISKITGFKGEIVEMTDEELYKWWEDRGVPRTIEDDTSKNRTPMKLVTDDLVSCGVVVRRGLMKEATDTVEKLTGRKPLSIDQIMQNYLDILPTP